MATREEILWELRNRIHVKGGDQALLSTPVTLDWLLYVLELCRAIDPPNESAKKMGTMVQCTLCQTESALTLNWRCPRCRNAVCKTPTGGDAYCACLGYPPPLNNDLLCTRCGKPRSAPTARCK